MKRLLLLVGLSALALLTACGISLNKGDLELTPYEVADFGGEVLMTVSEAAVTPKTSSMTLNIVNAADMDCTFGMEYALEVYLDDAWYKVPPKEEMFFIMIAQILEPGGMAQLEASLADAYGVLPEGQYRYVKSFSFEGGGTSAAAEFKIVKE